MKLPEFEYRVAGSVEDAVGLLAELGDEAKILAGGQSLIPLLSFRLARPACLIDVNGVAELDHITDGDLLEIGATVRHRAAERSATVLDRVPMLVSALAFVGHAAIRNRGTIGGSVAHADPSAELPTVLTALGGEVVVQSVRGRRTIAAKDLVEGFLTTSIEPDELLVSSRFPILGDRTGWAFTEFSRRSGDFAIVGVAAVLGLAADGRITRASLVYSGVGNTPERAAAAEALLVGEFPSDELWASAAESAGAGLDPGSDLHGSAAYRRQLAKILGRNALRDAYDRAVAHPSERGE